MNTNNTTQKLLLLMIYIQVLFHIRLQVLDNERKSPPNFVVKQY